MKTLQYCLLMVMTLATVGCTSNKMYRPDAGSVCSVRYGTSATDACMRAAIEKYEKRDARTGKTIGFELGFVEFDDLGMFYDRSQLDAVLSRLEEAIKDKPTVVYVYVHGWRHNASSDDEDVATFREVLDQASVIAKPSERVFGIYVGWRGKSLAGWDVWEYLSFWDRKSVAAHVAERSVRELFAKLRALRILERNREERRMQMLMIGHSFGGLVLYSAVSQYLMESAVCVDGCDDPLVVTPYADLIVLVNPAMEGARYESLHQAAMTRKYRRGQKPVLVVVTADSDLATKRAFPLGRWINTLFTDERNQEESEANRDTIGHIGRFETHYLRLCGEDIDGKPDPTAPQNCGCFNWDSKTDLSAENIAIERERSKAFYTRRAGDTINDRPWARYFCGGTVLHRLPNRGIPTDDPFWIVKTFGTEVIDGHGGITNPPFLLFLRQLFHDALER